jgi:hypothetical protein
MGTLRAILTAIAACALLYAPPLPASAAHQPGIAIHGALNGDILGYDVDQNGKEGVLAEFLTLGDGKSDVAVETFDQSTGKTRIIKEIKDTMDDFDAMPIVGSDVGLVLYQKLRHTGLYTNIYEVLDPLRKRRFTGQWTPNFGAHEFLLQVSRDQGQSQTAVLGGSDTGNAYSFVFATDVAANTFDRKIKLSDGIFDFNEVPVMAFDATSNVAVVASSFACRTCGTEIALVDLAKGTFSEFAGLGFGFVNGIAVDATDAIACTATEIDANVQFYDLATQSGFEVPMPGATSQEQSGTDVEYDPINRLFLVAQPVSSTGSGSSVQVFDTVGNLVESVNNLSLPVGGTVIALNPNTRTAFVPELTGVEVNELHSFSY